jgi:Tol biopolymer transport system component
VPSAAADGMTPRCKRVEARRWLLALGLSLLLARCSIHDSPAPQKEGQRWGLAARHADVALLSAIGGSSEYPTWSPDGESIAFQHTDSRDGYVGSFRDIYVIRTDDTGAERLTHEGQVGAGCGHPSWAPDSRRLACSCGSGREYDLYIIDLGDGGRTHLTDYPGEELEPAWSPDGLHVAFRSNLGAATHQERSIYVVDADGTDLRRLTEGSWDTNPAWAPDSDRIAFVSRQVSTSSASLCIVDREGVNLTCYRGFQCDFPAWSPDGSSIACTSRENILRLQLDDRVATTLLQTDSYVVEGLSWAPDGTRLALAAGNLVYDLYVLDVEP